MNSAQATQLTSSPVDFFDLEIEEAEQKIGELAGRPFHGRSFVQFVYKHGIDRVADMSSLPKRSRELLVDAVDLRNLPIKQRLDSQDGTVKFLLEVTTKKGPQEIECVYIPEDDRVTLCLSSQIGCKMACDFCLTAQLGFKSQLSAGDIVRQLWTVSQQLDLRPVTNLVFMGMGEPFDNFEEVKRATRILTHARGFNISARRVTVSTVGIVDKIDALTKEDPFRLAVSLNASRNEERSQLMPVNRRWPLEELMRACRDYSRRTNKRITFEYILMQGLTDRDEDAKRLIKLLSPLKAKLNLIPYNESDWTSFRRPSAQRVQEFHQFLLKAEIPVFIRKNRGNDIYAACGMLKKVDQGLQRPMASSRA